MRPEFKQCSKNEYDEYCMNISEPLTRDVNYIPEPPVLSMNDFSDGKLWPDSVVAYVQCFESYPKDDSFSPYTWAPNKYFIKEMQ